MFLSKNSAATGNKLWCVTYGGADDDFGNSVAVASDGSIYQTGSFRLTVPFGSTTLVSSGGDDVFVAKYTINGALVWVKRAGGSSSADSGNSLAISSNSTALYVTGNF
jgi:hypothetical protein